MLNRKRIVVVLLRKSTGEDRGRCRRHGPGSRRFGSGPGSPASGPCQELPGGYLVPSVIIDASRLPRADLSYSAMRRCPQDQ